MVPIHITGFHLNLQARAMDFHKLIMFIFNERDDLYWYNSTVLNSVRRHDGIWKDWTAPQILNRCITRHYVINLARRPIYSLGKTPDIKRTSWSQKRSGRTGKQQNIVTSWL
jgi:hypothetical protein